MKQKTLRSTLFWIGLICMFTFICEGRMQSVLPVNERIIALHIVDGNIRHARLGEIPWRDADVFIDPLDVESATTVVNYTITCEADPDFAEGVHPVNVFLKSKGVDFTDKVIPGAKINAIVKGHHLYLQLPEAMKSGQRYTIQFEDALGKSITATLFFDESQLRSDSIHVNQVGYRPMQRLKVGYVSHWMGDGGAMKLLDAEKRSFRLVNTLTGESVFEGKLATRREGDLPEPQPEFFKNDVAMTHVYECDFSELNTPGSYRLVVDGVGCSYPFEISSNALDEAYYVSVRGLFHHRSGIDRSEPHSSWPKPIEHRPGVNGFSIEYSTVKHMDGGNNFEGLETHATGWKFPDAKADWMPEDNDAWGWGGYFDAGDYDRHSGHIVAAEHLLFAYELTGGKFTDNELNLPESGNGVPDIIDEARWVIDCFIRLKGPTGGICGGMEQNEHPLPGENSVTDSRPWFVYAEEARASMRLAAAAAQLAYNLELAGHTEEIASLLAEAEHAYEWAMHSDDLDRVAEAHQRAAIWLYRTTGKQSYINSFHQLYEQGIRDNFACFVYAYDPSAQHRSDIETEIRETFIKNADYLMSTGMNNPLRRIEGAPSGWSTLNFLIHVHQLIFAYHLTGDSSYLDYVFTTCDYNLGNNPINRVFVTGLGENPVNEVFNMDSWYDGIEASIPGIVPYGLPTRFIGGNDAVWRPYQTFNSTCPNYDIWPTGELWFENRYLINCNEYTISETIGPAAGAYAYIARVIY